MDESNITRVGRPFGGLTILWNKNLALSIIPVETVSDRFCAMVIKSDNQSIVLCNVYMPCDNNTDENFEIYGDVLYEMLILFELYREYDFIIGEDCNVNVSHDSNNLTEHKPITLETTCSSIIISYENVSQTKIEWDKAT
ncbi:unnamed protein product [Meganyctiphanes norvegica]|uniref:Uncharacterized protein n=1 Tax=Meganyctiphanes norvegica TaxID=48144 RepID=A0AAV2QCB4_MEGNR